MVGELEARCSAEEPREVRVEIHELGSGDGRTVPGDVQSVGRRRPGNHRENVLDQGGSLEEVCPENGKHGRCPHKSKTEISELRFNAHPVHAQLGHR